MKTTSKIIVALDYPTIDQAREFVAKIDPSLCRLKVASTMFTRYGPEFVRELTDQGFDIFLDLKFYDIPTQTAGACFSCAQLGVWMINLHILGGQRMMQATYDELSKIPKEKRPLIIGVTILTSMNEQDLAELGIGVPITELVEKLALMAKAIGLDGVVCSSQEASLLRKKLGKEFLLVTPGIRLSSDAADDQRRIMTPEAAIKAGADYLVIGRSITHAKDPRAMLENIHQSIAALNNF